MVIGNTRLRHVLVDGLGGGAMSNLKMREALEYVRHAAHINDYGDWALDCGFDMSIVDEALAQQPAAVVELPDAELMDIARPTCGNFRWPSTALDIMRQAIAAHIAKQGVCND
jgi:hypothetical protein